MHRSMQDAAAVLERLIVGKDDLRILAIAGGLWSAFAHHAGELFVIAPPPAPAPPTRPRGLTFAAATNDAEIAAAVGKLNIDHRKMTFDLILLQHEGDDEALIARANSLNYHLTPETVVGFVLPPAAPNALRRFAGRIAATGPAHAVIPIPCRSHRLLFTRDFRLTRRDLGHRPEVASAAGDAAALAVLDTWLVGLGRDRPLMLAFPEQDVPPRIARRLVIESSRPWRRPPPRLLLDLAAQPGALAPLFLENLTEVPEKLLDTFTDAYLVSSAHFIIDNVFQPSYRDGSYATAELLATRDFGSETQRNAAIFAIRGGFAIAERKLEQPIVIDETVMFATPLEAHNWAVWLFHALPAIARFQRDRERYAKLFVHAEYKSMRETLAMLGVGAGDIIHHDLARTYRFREVDLLRHQELQFFVDPQEREIFQRLVISAEATEPEPPSRRIYVSRRSRGDYRRLVNEDELIEALGRLGFAAIEPERLSAARQVRAFAGAEAVVGLGGAGMFNTVFCRAGTKVLDIESSTSFMLTHAGLFASAGLDYGMILGEQDPTDPRPVHGRWRLDVAAAMPHLVRFFGL